MEEDPEKVEHERNDPLRDVRAALRERRKQLGLSQQEIATRMNLKSRTNVAELEKGAHDVGTQRLARWVAAVEGQLTIKVANGRVEVVALEDL
jgi:transcriptional regulator with XRE-family HTH domain